MARRKAFEENYKECPVTLEQHPFYGLQLDDEQKIFRDAIWSPDNDIVFCDAMAGCGKTLIAVATANLLVQYGRYDGIAVGLHRRFGTLLHPGTRIARSLQ